MDNPMLAAIQRRPARATLDPITAKVVRVDDSGTWIVPLDDDTRHPVGPCRGPVVAVDDIVLVIHTDEAPWIAQVDDA